MTTKDIKCKNCGHTRFHIVQRFDVPPHSLELRCNNCDNWIKWLSNPEIEYNKKNLKIDINVKLNQKNRLKIFRDILSKYGGDEFLNEEDFKIIIELFKNHPNWKIKEGNGIDKIQVRFDKWGKKAYLIHRKDGSITDISFIIASKGYDASIEQRIKSACRYAISPIIIAEQNKIRWGIQKCPLSGEILKSRHTHIDHYDLSFAELFKAWIKTMDYNEIVNALNDSKQDNVTYDFFINKEIEQNFIAFHNTNTHLRAITAKENLKKRK